MAPLWVVLAVALLLELFTKVSYSTIGNRAYMLYRQTFKKEKDDELKKRRKEILDIKGDLSRTSAQDEFSKWAKLRRKLDKQVAEYEKECKSGSMDKAKFEVAVSWGLWAAMLFFQAVVMLAYRTTAMFYIPLEWSGPLHWILSFPFAPKGSVSVVMWVYVVRSVMQRALARVK